MPDVDPNAIQFRKFGDHAATREAVFVNALEAVRKLPPAENARYRLAIENPHYAKDDKYSIADHKRAILEGRSLARRLIGTYVLTDKASGNVIDKRSMTVAAIPWLTSHGTFLQDGTGLPISHQLRLLPGIFTRRTQAGVVSSHVNVHPGSGITHHISLDPATGVFKTRIGQAEIPTMPLLRALGVPDDRLKEVWGDVLFSRNAKAEKPHHLERYWEKFGPPGPVPDGIDYRQALHDRLTKYPLDPWVMKRTTGVETDRYGGEPLLAATKKILDVVKGHAEPDARDHPAFSMVMGPEHTLPERITKVGGPYMAKALWAATNTGSLKRVVPGLLSPAVRSLFTKSGLALTAEGNSAAEYLDHGSRITKVGEGGVGRSADSVPLSARDYHIGQYPFIDPIRTSESTAVGVDLRTAFGTRLGSDNRIYAPLIDRRTNRLVFRNPQHLFDSVLAVPGSMNGRNPVVEVVRGGRLTYAPRHEVDYIAPAMEQTFSPLTNMVPLKSASKAHRPSMGARYIAQSLPLEKAEAPFVRTQVPNQPGKSFEELYGRHMGPIHADAEGPGVVTEVTKDHIAVRYANGSTKKHELYRAFPSGRMTSLQSYPVVKPGDPIQPGQMLARSNYTDEKGHAAYGRNLRVGFMLGHGEHSVYEDSIAISQSAAEKLKSHHMYQHSVSPDDDVMIGKHAHAAAFGGKHTLDVLKTVGDDGLVKPGTVVNYGDPLIMAVRRKVGEFGRLSRSGRAALSDASETWEHHEPGVVEDAIQSPNGPIVTVSTYKPAVDADKVSSWHGNKGVVRVVPDHKMPVGEDGRPLEMIFSSLGTVSRANPSAIYASILGKVAEKTGQPYIVSDFDDQADGRNIGAWVAGEARKHGVKFKETLTDPASGRKIPGVGVGTMYVMKLLHMAEKKQKGRGLGAYDETGQPLRGQSGKAMRSSLGDTNALLGYGATSVIHDDHIYKGAANEEFWAQFMQGYPVTKPDSSPAFDRFLTELQAAGADPVRKDGRLQLMPLTSKRIHEMAGDRVVRNAETFDFSKNGEPYPGGLFDPSITGSPDSAKTWAKIPLHEPMVNPASEDGARRLLGLTEKNFRETIAGRHSIPTGTGPTAIAKALESLDVQTELKKVRELAKSSRKTTRDEANRRLFYLKGLERTGLQPKDWIVDAVPVLPPLFRPVRAGGPRGEAITADANLLYSDLINANSSLKELSAVTKDVGAEHLNLYDAMKAVIGLGDPVGAKNRERGVTGVLGRLLGSSAKYGYAQQKLLGTTINLSGRGTILPNPDLDMDQAGIPEPVAWEIFHPFIVRRMIRSGMSRVEAAKAVEDRNKIAKDHLLAEMEVRPVRLTRYPALHRFSTMGFRPVLSPGNATQTNHIITKPYNADFDGDTMTVSVPLSDDAVAETYDKMLPSRNLYSPASVGKLTFVPGGEDVPGFYAASTADAGNPPVAFPNRKAAVNAYKSNDPSVSYNTRVVVGDEM